MFVFAHSSLIENLLYINTEIGNRSGYTSIMNINKIRGVRHISSESADHSQENNCLVSNALWH